MGPAEQAETFRPHVRRAAAPVLEEHWGLTAWAHSQSTVAPAPRSVFAALAADARGYLPDGLLEPTRP